MNAFISFLLAPTAQAASVVAGRTSNLHAPASQPTMSLRAKKISILLLLASVSLAARAQSNILPATGRVGLGTTQPLDQLDVRGGNILVKNLANTTNESAIMIAHSIAFGAHTTFGTSLRTLTENEGSNQYALQFFTQGNWQTGQIERMRISGDGNVSIGIAGSSPAEKLTIAGNVAVLDGSGYHVSSSNGLTWANTKLIWRNWDGIDYTEIGVPGHTSNQARIRLNANGNVGIGTSTPPEKLSVDGKILATEVKVASVSNWPDYVFQPDYRKMSLRETETYIKRYGHLPEVPDAAAAHNDGIELAEMNKLLLKKIEELTLHLIKKEHQIDAMEAQNKQQYLELQKQIDLLKLKK